MCDSGDGGALRVYYPAEGSAVHGPAAAPVDEEAERFVDVAPLAGRLVIFDSRRVAHEVRPTYGERWAVTLWAQIARRDV